MIFQYKLLIMKKLLFYFALIPAVLFVAAKCDDDNKSMVDLPASIQNYLNTNYAGAEIEESEMDTLCTGTAVYEVEVEVSEDNEIELTFDTEGNLLFTEKEIASSQLPAAVTSGINAQYAGASVQEAERLDLADGGNQYEVELKQGQTYREVLFTAEGTVICEETGDDDEDDE